MVHEHVLIAAYGINENLIKNDEINENLMKNNENQWQFNEKLWN